MVGQIERISFFIGSITDTSVITSQCTVAPNSPVQCRCPLTCATSTCQHVTMSLPRPDSTTVTITRHGGQFSTSPRNVQLVNFSE